MLKTQTFLQHLRTLKPPHRLYPPRSFHPILVNRCFFSHPSSLFSLHSFSYNMNESPSVSTNPIIPPLGVSTRSRMNGVARPPLVHVSPAAVLSPLRSLPIPLFANERVLSAFKSLSGRNSPKKRRISAHALTSDNTYSSAKATTSAKATKDPSANKKGKGRATSFLDWSYSSTTAISLIPQSHPAASGSGLIPSRMLIERKAHLRK